MAEEKKADAPKEEAKKGKAEKGGPPGKATFILGGLCFGASIWFIYPSLLLLLGMIPTIVAIFTVTDEKQNANFQSVAAMNAAGVFPFIIDLWMRGQTLGAAIDILRTPATWVVMFGAAAVGQLILFAVPQFIASISLSNAESRVKILKENLETLKLIWGPDVATTKSLEQVMRSE